MRVVLVTSEEPLYLPEYIYRILDSHADVIDRLVIVPFDAPLDQQVREYFGMYGFRAGAQMAIRFLVGQVFDAVVTVLDQRVRGRFHSVASVARARDIPYERVPDVSDLGFINRIRKTNPDVILSVVAGQRLPSELLACATEAINMHGSLLPKYRGRATAFWPLYYGDDRTGVTAHRMTEEFDAGPIIAQRAFPIVEKDTVDSVYRKLARTGATLSVDLLDSYPDLPDSSPNETTREDYHGIPSSEERRRFFERGNSFF